MRRTVLRLLGIAVVGAAIGLATSGRADASRSLYRCYIDTVDYYADAACTEIVGAVARGCDWQIAWEWGVQSGYWIQYIDGGYNFCPLEGCKPPDPEEDPWEWHETHYNCPERPSLGKVSPTSNSR